jgi:hypothetical protein
MQILQSHINKVEKDKQVAIEVKDQMISSTVYTVAFEWQNEINWGLEKKLFTTKHISSWN